MNFISFDFGLYTGYSVFKDNTFEKAGSFKVIDEFSKIPVSVVFKAKEIILKNHKRIKLDCIVAEDYLMNTKRFVNMSQPEIIGALKYFVITELGINIYFINTKQARKVLLNEGRASKSKIKKEMFLKVGKLKNQHEYDSAMIGFAFLDLKDRLTESTLRRSLILKKT